MSYIHSMSCSKKCKVEVTDRVGRIATRVRTLLSDETGQTTAEYALVLLAAAAIALLLLAWAAGTDGIGRLFDAVIDSIIGKVG